MNGRFSRMAVAGSVLLAVAVSMAQADGGDKPKPRPVTGAFKLAVQARVILPPNVGAVRLIRLTGTGRAAAGKAVRIRLSPLTADAAPVSAIVRFEPLKRGGALLRRFRGTGVAVVTVGRRTVRLRLVIHGHIRRTDKGAVMVAQFRSAGDPPLLAGRIAGRKIPNDSDE